MLKQFYLFCAGSLLLLTVVSSVSVSQTSNKKLAQTGMKFLVVGTSGRETALAEAFTSLENGSSSMFYNPAGMATFASQVDASVGRTEWIADIVHYNFALAYRPFEGDYGVFGISMQFVNYGDVQSTILANNTDGYLDVGTFRPSAYAIGIGYARSLSNKFSLGANIKFVDQNLGEGITAVSYTPNRKNKDSVFATTSSVRNVLDLLAFDFGILYKTGYKSLAFGMTLRNFSREASFIKESFQLPLSFKMGISMNVLDFADIAKEVHSMNVSVDAEHPRDYPEQLRMGFEYIFQNTLALRYGYVSPSDQQSNTFGVGLQQSLGGATLNVDYSYSAFKDFNSVQRISFRFGF